LDFTTVEHIDVTSAQILQDVRAQLDRHASPDVVEWHFAGVSRPWVKRALAAAGFGRIDGPGGIAGAEPIYSVAKVKSEGSDQLAKVVSGTRSPGGTDIETGRRPSTKLDEQVGEFPVLSLARGAFHIDVPAALDSVSSRHGKLTPVEPRRTPTTPDEETKYFTGE
jgi:sodium-independent sulfate anion transporter 11